MRGKKSMLINKNTEIYGACRHKASLHVYEQVTTKPGTDEGNNPEKEAEWPALDQTTLIKLYTAYYFILHIIYLRMENYHNRMIYPGD